jgi:hypothetical protein
VLNNYTTDDSKRWLFADEMFLHLDGVYNAQNDRMWAANGGEAGSVSDFERRNN